MRSALFASVVVLIAATPARADSECLANGTFFQIGQIACLMPSSTPYLARCDEVLNNTSWVKLQDGCSKVEPAPHADAKPLSEISSPAEPAQN